MSALANKPVNPGFAFTGEVAIHGEVGAVGGIPQKINAAIKAGRKHVGAIADGVDIGPSADVIRADLGLFDQVLGVRDLGEIKLLVETIVRIEPADV